MVEESNVTAMADTEARALGLEIVVTAVLGHLAANNPEMQSVLAELAEPGDLKGAAKTMDAEALDHVQTNVARLARAIAVAS